MAEDSEKMLEEDGITAGRRIKERSIKITIEEEEGNSDSEDRESKKEEERSNKDSSNKERKEGPRETGGTEIKDSSNKIKGGEEGTKTGDMEGEDSKIDTEAGMAEEGT